MAKYLDNDGLLYVWQKLKTLLAGKVDTVAGKGLSTNDFTAEYKTKLDGIAAGANVYTHPTFTPRTSGLYKITVDSNGHVSAAVAVAKADITGLGIPAQDTTYPDMSPATSAGSGAHGLVPAPVAGDQVKFLRGDGTWVIPKDTNTTYTIEPVSKNISGIGAYVASIALKDQNGTQISNVGIDTVKQSLDSSHLGGQAADFYASKDVATSSADGLMASADKAKLDAIPTPSTIATQTDIEEVLDHE